MKSGSAIVPLYKKIKSHIIEKIHAGELGPNARVPSEHELVRLFKVSRMTVNRALKELEMEGLLTRVPGVGTFVAQTQTTGHLLQVTNIADDVRERGHSYSIEVVKHERAVPPKLIADWMGIAPRRKIFNTVVIHRENEIPIQLEERYVSPIGAPNYKKIDLNESTPSAFLLANVPLQRVEHTVRATMPASFVRHKLQMKKAVPCLVLDRKTWSRETPVSFVHLYHSGAAYALSDSFLPKRH